jgi:hypothetical protein
VEAQTEQEAGSRGNELLSSATPEPFGEYVGLDYSVAALERSNSPQGELPGRK